jgi:hypothetical protein
MSGASPQERVIELREKAEALREPYKAQLQAFLALAELYLKVPDPPKELKEALDDAHSAGLALFNAYETMVQDSGLLGAHDNKQWVADLAGSCYGVLELVLSHYQRIRETCRHFGFDTRSYRPTRMAYRAMWRIVAECCNPKETDRLRKRFERERFAVNTGEAEMSDEHQPDDHTGAEDDTEGDKPPPDDHAGGGEAGGDGEPDRSNAGFFWVGVLFSVVAIGLAVATFVKGDLTDDQRWTLHEYTYIAAAFAAGSFLGSLTIKSRKWIPGVSVSAVGGFAVWLLCHYFDRGVGFSKRAVSIMLVQPDGSPVKEKLPIVVRFGDEPHAVDTQVNGTAQVAIPVGTGKVDRVDVTDPRYEVDSQGPYTVVADKPISITLKPRPVASRNPGILRKEVSIFLYDENKKYIRDKLKLTVWFGTEFKEVDSSEAGSVKVSVPIGTIWIDRIECDDPLYEIVTTLPHRVEDGQPINLTLKRIKPGAAKSNSGQPYAGIVRKEVSNLLPGEDSILRSSLLDRSSVPDALKILLSRFVEGRAENSDRKYLKNFINQVRGNCDTFEADMKQIEKIFRDSTLKLSGRGLKQDDRSVNVTIMTLSVALWADNLFNKGALRKKYGERKISDSAPIDPAELELLRGKFESWKTYLGAKYTWENVVELLEKREAPETLISNALAGNSEMETFAEISGAFEERDREQLKVVRGEIKRAEEDYAKNKTFEIYFRLIEIYFKSKCKMVASRNQWNSIKKVSVSYADKADEFIVSSYDTKQLEDLGSLMKQLKVAMTDCESNKLKAYYDYVENLDRLLRAFHDFKN